MYKPNIFVARTMGANMRANRKLLQHVADYLSWAEELGLLRELKDLLKAKSKEEILERFRQTEDAVTLAEEFGRAIGYVQADNSIPFAYGFTDPPDLCGRRVACRPMAE
ncbi:MAG: hypothetical protein INF43_01095 [Alphaproteobacteria bacterium]|nr:hypothetical protein [Alphaproteobacteria bacterium]